MPWGVAAAAVAAYGTYAAGKKGANAQKSSNQAAIAEQQREYDQSRADQLPFLQAGQNALNLQQKFLAGDTSGFQNAADYKFAVDQGFKGLDRGAAARGNLWGGGADADRIALGQGLATQYANNYWNKLAGMAGQGQTSAGNLGSLGANAAGNIGGYLQNQGAATASSYANAANSFGNFANQAANMYGQYQANYIPPVNASYGAPTQSAPNYSYNIQNQQYTPPPVSF